MSVDDFCRLCKDNLRVNGNLANTKKIFDSKIANNKSVYERLIDLGLTLSRCKSRSSRICRSCLRVLGRIENDFAIFRRWQYSEKDPEPSSEVLSPSVPKPCDSDDGFAESPAQTVSIQDKEPTPSKMPMSIIPPTLIRTPHRKLPRPNTESEAPPRHSQTEVTIRYPSHPKGDRIICKPNTAGMVENIAKENWRTAANLIVRHKELFGQLKDNVLQVIEDESKMLCNPYKGFMLWRSSANDLKAFSFANLQSDLQRMSPLLYSIISQISKQSPYSTCTAAAIALKGREPRLSAFAYYVDSVLQYGGARKAVFNRLSKLGITTSHTCAVRKQKELVDVCGKDFQLLKVANESDVFKEDGDATDAADGGNAVRGEESDKQMAPRGPATAVAELDILIVDSDEEEPSPSSTTQNATQTATQTGADHKRKMQDTETDEASPKRQCVDQCAAAAADDKAKHAEVSPKRQCVDQCAATDDAIKDMVAPDS